MPDLFANEVLPHLLQMYGRFVITTADKVLVLAAASTRSTTQRLLARVYALPHASECRRTGYVQGRSIHGKLSVLVEYQV